MASTAIRCPAVFRDAAIHRAPAPVRRKLTRLHALPATAGIAMQHPGLVLPAGEQGSWDEAGVGHPVVRYFLGDNEQRWFLWYSGRGAGDADVDAFFPGSGSVGIAMSSDGVEWVRGAGPVQSVRDAEGRPRSEVGCVLPPNADAWWWHDTCHLHASDVQLLSNSSVGTGAGVYWMFYSGGSFEAAAVPEGLARLAGVEPGTEVEGMRLRPGLAMSQDGRNWARIEAEHHTGALFDVGGPGEWDELFVGAPQVGWCTGGGVGWGWVGWGGVCTCAHNVCMGMQGCRLWAGL
jgi:hypothetical protein